MRAKVFRDGLRDFRHLVFALTAITGLMLCFTAMLSLPSELGAETASASATSLAVHHSSPAVSADGLFGTIATCQGPCGQDHFMMATACGIALLVPFLLIGAARLSATWRPFARRLQSRLERGGALPPSMPPSLVLLSISRT
ncbi:MAG: hypothetical protein ABIW32_00165 [Terrimesophilobacter sp.]